MRQALGPGALGRPGRDWVEREVGGGIGMGKTCKLKDVSFQCMTKFTTKKNKIKLKKKKKSKAHSLIVRRITESSGGKRILCLLVSQG